MHDENEVLLLLLLLFKIEGSSDVLIAYCTPGGGN
jgi:hypothetical protein